MLRFNQKSREKSGKANQLLAYKIRLDEKHFSLAIVNIMKEMSVKL